MPTTSYIWDPLNDSYLMETDKNGATTAVYTQESAQYGGLVSQRQGTDTNYVHQDVLGSTRVLSDEGGAVIDTFIYDSWGKEIDRTGTTDTYFRWIGRAGYYFDQATNTYYVRARRYCSQTVRWLSGDPILSDPGQSPYMYCSNSPSRHIDPAGLEWRFISDQRGGTGGGTQSYGTSQSGCATTKDGVRSCCLPTPKWNPAVYSSKISVDAVHFNSVLCFQSVDTTVTFTISPQSPITGRDRSACPSACCPGATIVITENFIEVFSPWKVPNINIFEDNHSVGDLMSPYMAALQMCSPQVNGCCGWEYRKVTNKVMACAAAGPTLSRAANSRSPNELKITGARCDCGTWSPGITPGAIAYPGGNVLANNLQMPNTKTPGLVGSIVTREDIWTASYARYADSIEWSHYSLGYKPLEN